MVRAQTRDAHCIPSLWEAELLWWKSMNHKVSRLKYQDFECKSYTHWLYRAVELNDEFHVQWLVHLDWPANQSLNMVDNCRSGGGLVFRSNNMTLFPLFAENKRRTRFHEFETETQVLKFQTVIPDCRTYWRARVTQGTVFCWICIIEMVIYPGWKTCCCHK